MLTDNFYTESDLKKTLRTLEEQGQLLVERNPCFTKTGKKTTFWKEDKEKKLLVSLK